MTTEYTTSAIWNELTIAIPAYSRSQELEQLLESIKRMDVLPGEVLVCEDKSPQRARIREVVDKARSGLAGCGCDLVYIENIENLGYDGNLRQLFARATRKWVMLMGNDDLVLPSAIRSIQGFLENAGETQVMSRSYLKFQGDLAGKQGTFRFDRRDRIFGPQNCCAGQIIRLVGFVSGLVVLRSFAVEAETAAYDGTLYYQLYLATLAFFSGGIGYIKECTVASRVGNPPLFGSSSAESNAHTPGRYTAEARLAMWDGILRICADVERDRKVSLVGAMRRELAGRQSIHVFEHVAAKGRAEVWKFSTGLWRRGLMNVPLAWVVCMMSLMLGERVGLAIGLVRKTRDLGRGLMSVQVC